jgi:hypothetical protein
VPAYYSSSTIEFLHQPVSAILGKLTAANARFGFLTTETAQVEAWQDEIDILATALAQLHLRVPSSVEWGILLEFPIPRRQQRVDVILLAHDVIFALEFKCGTSDQHWAAMRQVEDYALDLSDFHAPSHNRLIIPIVVAPGEITTAAIPTIHNVKPVSCASAARLSTVLLSEFSQYSRPESTQISLADWNHGIYHPVPTIIEAATALYAGMSVREITHSHAGAHNLTKTTDFVLRVVSEAQGNHQKIACFVTGIPGAGKTLAGLNVVHNPDVLGNGRPASVFMSGNGPLVDILREALALDSARRTTKSKKTARREVRTFIQNIHHFVHDNLEREDNQPPYEHAIVFDEAQRAWNAHQNRRKYRKRSQSWHISEPEMVLKVMDRHRDWAVIVALVGGGQEIHHGEAGLPEWGRTLQAKYAHWRIVASPEALQGAESVAGGILFQQDYRSLNVTQDPSLHLNTCIRSHRAARLTEWVNRMLAGDSAGAANISQTFDSFPILLTRDLIDAKTWLSQVTRGARRCGLVASSGAARLRAYGLETSKAIRDAYSYPRWFLAPRGDVRASYQLETLATEFEIQGLELDRVGICWGGDFTWNNYTQAWKAAEFKGTKWTFAGANKRMVQTRNKYRVLLTRAREGIIIWVPKGDETDSTRDIVSMDNTADYLLQCGAVPLTLHPHQSV